MACPADKRLIINADDFGLAPEVNRAVIDCYQAGSLTSVTLMVNAAGTAEAAALACRHPGLGVGLHFNLTHGRPVCPPQQVPALVDAGGLFWGRKEFELRMLSGRIPLEEVHREFQAQVNAFNATGLTMSHIDSHHHVHMFPLVFATVVRFARHEELPVRIPRVSWGFVRPSAGYQAVAAFGKKVLLMTLVHISTRRAGAGINAPDRLFSIYDIIPLPAELSPAVYRLLLRNPKPGVTELMVHPAFRAPALERMFAGSWMKDQERRVLCRRSLIADAERLGLKAATYRELSPRLVRSAPGDLHEVQGDSQKAAIP